MLVEKLSNDPRCLHFVECFDRLLEHVLRQRLDLLLIELVFYDHFQDQCLLLIRAGPLVVVGGLVGVGTWLIRAMTVARLGC